MTGYLSHICIPIGGVSLYITNCKVHLILGLLLHGNDSLHYILQIVKYKQINILKNSLSPLEVGNLGGNAKPYFYACKSAIRSFSSYGVTNRRYEKKSPAAL